MRNIILIILSSILLFSCAKQGSSNQYNNSRNNFYEEYSKEKIRNHKSILILPPANNSVNIDAPFYVFSTISYPIAEKGYYVFPVNLVNRLLEDEGMGDAYILSKSSPLKIAKMFGADAILYTTIESWEAKYVGIATIITASLTYILKSGKTGEILWKNSHTVTYDSNQSLRQQNSLEGLLLTMVINATASKAMADGKHYELVKSANMSAFKTGPNSLPNGTNLRAKKNIAASK